MVNDSANDPEFYVDNLLILWIYLVISTLFAATRSVPSVVQCFILRNRQCSGKDSKKYKEILQIKCINDCKKIA